MDIVLRYASTAVAAAFWFASGVQAQTVVETEMFGSYEPHIGNEYRQDVADALRLAQQQDLDGAWTKLKPVLAYCDAQQRPGRQLVSVADGQEYETYLATRTHTEPTEWIDIACPSAYYHAAYLHVSAKRFDEALPLLDKAIALAPYYAMPHNERGFILNQQGRLRDGIESYRKAIRISDAHPSAAYAKPAALRGIGWAQIELGELDQAQKTYEEVLALEPDNGLAKRELECIAQQRAKAAGR